MFDRFGNWNNFPIGLRVLAVDSDWDYLNAIKTALESYQYVVSAFTSADDALAALQNAPNPFHVALVEAATKDSLDGFKILKTATTIPTIMMSNGEDMPLMMQSIALGAADFLQKPVSEEKLRNIWQHVARKALNAGDSLTSPSMPSIARSDAEMTPQIKVKDEEQYDIEETGLGLPFFFTDSREIESTTDQDPKLEQEEMISRETAPLEIEAKVEEEEEDDFCYKFSLDDIGLTDAIVPQHTDLDSCIFGLADSDTDSALDVSFHMLNSSQKINFIRKEDQHIFKSPSLLETSIGDNIEMPVTSAQEHGKGKSRSGKESKCPNSKKKMKIDWTPDLHRKFVQAVEQLGVDKAIPSRILELMGVKGLTRHNVASHLQKYRSHRKHLLIREAEAANWQNRAWYRARNGWSQNSVQPRQPLLIPTVPLHVWGHPTSDYSAMHMWQHAPPQTPTMWQAPDGTMWQHPGTWVEPVPVPGTPVLYPQTLGKGTEPFLKSFKTVACSTQDSFADNEFIADAPTSSGDSTLTRSTNELPSNPSKELVDAMISEALSNPSTTLPLGLKPPSMESVVAELGKKGIVIVPSGPSS